MANAELKEGPFDEVIRDIDDRLHPKGPPAEPQPIPVTSIEGTVQLFADELQEQALKTPLMDLLHGFQDNPVVDWCGVSSYC